jgi:hypothetical protein
MKIKLSTSIAGKTFAYAAGDEADFPEGEALDLIQRGSAVPVRQPKIERATVAKTVERAVKGTK